MADRIAVIGAGQMGNGIAHVFAQSGFPVTMIDVSQDALHRGMSTISKNLDRQLKKGTLKEGEPAEIMSRISL
jgi:3-hydroxybutyryl-CoA dehydrogenase